MGCLRTISKTLEGFVDVFLPLIYTSHIGCFPLDAKTLLMTMKAWHDW